MRMRLAIAAALLAAAACERTPPADRGSGSSSNEARTPSAASPAANAESNPLPLSPQMDALKSIVAQSPPALTPESAADLKELIEIAHADDADEDIAGRAARRLENDPHAVLALEAALDHVDPAIRARCAYALAARRDVASAPALLVRLMVEQDRSVKLWLAGALLKIGIHCPPAIDAVAAHFGDSDLATDASQILNDVLDAAQTPLSPTANWDEARAAFAKLREHWIEEGYALGSQRPACDRPEDLDPRLRGILADALVQLSEFQLRPVDEARYTLRNLGLRSVPLLRLALTASESYVRAHAVEIARDLGPAAKPLSDVILMLLDDPLTRLTAIQAAGLSRAANTLPRLRELFASDDPELACAASAALGEIGDEASRMVLQTRMNDPSLAMDLRIYAAFGLSRLDRTTEDGGEGAAFLRAAKTDGLYHEPTLDELLMNSKRR